MRLKELTIIQYQNVSKNPDAYRLWLSTDSFQKQIEYLSANNFQFLSMDDAILYMKRKKSVENGRPISLTFDNGYQEFYENVFPILTQKQYPATILISPSKVGTSTTMGTTKVDYLSWGTLKELRRNDIIIGAYEDAAWNVNDIPEDVVREHIVEYKKILEDKLGEEITNRGPRNPFFYAEIADFFSQLVFQDLLVLNDMLSNRLFWDIINVPGGIFIGTYNYIISSEFF